MIVPVCEECIAKIRSGIIPPPVQGSLTAKEYCDVFYIYCRARGIHPNSEFARVQFYIGLSAKSIEQLPAGKEITTIVDTVNLLTAIEHFEREIFGCQKDTA